MSRRNRHVDQHSKVVRFRMVDLYYNYMVIIECTRGRLLLPLLAVSVRQSVSLSRGSTRLHYAKTAALILFRVNTVGGPRKIVLYGGPDPL